MRKLRDVILKAIARKLNWIEAAEIAGMTSHGGMTQVCECPPVFDHHYSEHADKSNTIPWELVAFPLVLHFAAFVGLANSRWPQMRWYTWQLVVAMIVAVEERRAAFTLCFRTQH